MRTKTLLLAAAAIAAGVITTQAQSNVYSANVVGYYNIVTPAGGYNFVANQLTNAGNDVNVVLGSGAVSDVNGVLNTTLFKWNGNGYNIYQYFTGPDADNYFLIGPGSPAGYYDAVGTLAVETLAQGSGSFIYNPAAVAITNTFVGEVVQGSSTIPLTTGFNAYSIVQPLSTNIDSALINYPGTSDVNGVNNDVLYKFNGNGYNIVQYFSGVDADNYFLIGPGSPSGFYDAVGTYMSLDPGIVPKVGDAFFILRFGGAGNWTYTYNVQ